MAQTTKLPTGYTITERNGKYLPYRDGAQLRWSSDDTPMTCRTLEIAVAQVMRDARFMNRVHFDGCDVTATQCW